VPPAATVAFHRAATRLSPGRERKKAEDYVLLV
jgi:hypothetical protein